MSLKDCDFKIEFNFYEHKNTLIIKQYSKIINGKSAIVNQICIFGFSIEVISYNREMSYDLSIRLDRMTIT